MRLKKITAWILLLAMLISYTAYGQEDSKKEADKSSQILLSMKIINEEQPLEKEVTRGEFAGLMANIFRVTWDNSHSVPSFMDVNEKHKYYGDICWLLDRKAISEGNLFEPDRSILMSEAAKIMVSLLGYDFFAKEQGGYPSGYTVQASDKGLLKDISFDAGKPLTYSDAYKMMVSMLESEPYVDPEDKVNGEKYERTLMYHVFNARKIEGIVTSDGITAIKNSKVSIENCISIDNSVFEITDTVILGDYIGYNVEAYVYNEDDIDKVCYISLADNAEIEILSTDIYDISNGIVQYVVDGKDRKIKLNNAIEFIYNNVCESFESYAEIIPTQGRMKFIDNDDDGKYDIVKAYQYSDMILTYVDVQNKKLYDNKRGIVLELDSDDVKYSIIKDGEIIDIENLSVDDVLTYYKSRSGEIIQIYVSDNIMEGVVKSFRNENGKNILTINDAEYIVAEDCNLIPDAGYKGEYKLNIYNDIVWVGYMFGEGKTFGYVMKAYFDDLEEKFTVKMCTSNGFIEEIECADKVTLDGYRTSDMTKIYSVLCCDDKGNNTGAIVRQPIRYEINNKYEIVLIDSLQSGFGGENDELSLDRTGTFHHMYRVFSNQFGINSDTNIFIIPGSRNMDAIKKGNAGIFTNDRSYSVTAYNLSDTNIAELLLVDGTNNSLSYSTVMAVEKVYTELVDDEVMTAVKGVVGGKLNTIYMYPEVVDVIIEAGDVIVCDMDYEKKLKPIMLYDHSEGNTASYSRYSIIKGRVKSIDDSYFLVEINDGTENLYNLGNVGFIVRHKSERNDTYETIEYSEIQDNEEILILKTNISLSGAIIY